MTKIFALKNIRNHFITMLRVFFRIFVIFFVLISLTLLAKGLINETVEKSSSQPSIIVNVVGDTKIDAGLLDSAISWLSTVDLMGNFVFLFGNDPADVENVDSIWNYFDHTKITWIWSAIASIIVALTGVIPAIFLSSHPGARKEKDGERKLNRLLSFAVGSLLGDVFLHILPETWRCVATEKGQAQNWGMWVIFGSVLCFLVEKCASGAEDSKHKAAAFVNLCANAIDNFTHGLAVGASFSVSIKFGVLTTFAILIHEIPHEISDFAILLRADFDRWSAVKAQLLTATGGVLGASVALMANSDAAGLEHKASSWILPFTAGGFLNVALVQVLPDLLKEKSVTESAMQILYIFTGVCLMGFVNAIHV